MSKIHLRSLPMYCYKEALEINYSKIKIWILKSSSWRLNDQTIEQVIIFKYLGIVFHKSTKCRHIKTMQRSAIAIPSFHYSRWAQHFLKMLKLYLVKVHLKLLLEAHWNLTAPFSLWKQTSLISKEYIPFGQIVIYWDNKHRGTSD